MGISLDIKCENCDLHQPGFLIGSGFGQRLNWEPAYCRYCNHVVGADSSIHGNICPDCGEAGLRYYFGTAVNIKPEKTSDSDQEFSMLYKSNGPEKSSFCSNMFFQDSNKVYLCPRCHEFKLRLSLSGILWD